jgi:hypothetical protein
MPFIALRFKPGLNRDQTNYSNEGGWYECDKIRFLSGYPQKIGGWQKRTPNSFIGTCREMWNWSTTYGDDFLAVGTEKKLYIEAGGYFYDITPLQATTSAGDVTFSASNGSSTVTVLDTSAPAEAGNYVQFSGAASLGGNITAAVLNQTYEIATVVNANAYTITALDPTTGAEVTANASDVGSGGASTVGKYQIDTGTSGGEFGYGWGTDTWGRLEWGLGGTTPVLLEPRTWFYNNFNNDLVANINEGAIYYWERGTNSSPASALETNAVLLSSLAGAASVPVVAGQVLVSQNDEHLLVFGAVPYGSSDPNDYDPLLIRWASQSEPQKFEPTPTNSAGFIRLARGFRIVRAWATRQEILVWTEGTLNSLQFTGNTDVFALQELADNISIMSPRCVATANNVTYWMGRDKFYAYSGRVETLPCTLRQYVFQDINTDSAYTTIAGTNEGFNEVWWIYPSANSASPNRYVIYNYLEKIWYYGTIDRTAWLDSPLRSYPMSLNTPSGSDTGYLYNQESGVDADGAILEAYIQSSDFDISDGEQLMLTRRMIPDINFNNSTANEPEVTLQIRPRNFPGTTFQADSADSKRVIETSVGVYTDEVFIRARGRQVALKISSDTLGTNWQLGVPRLDARTDGKR